MSAISDAMSAALVNFLWQGTVVGLLLWMARIALRQRSANDRYAASCAALVLLAVLPAITIVVLYLRALPVEMRIARADSASAALVAAQRDLASAVSGADSSRTTWIDVLRFWALPVWSAGVLLCSARIVCAGAHVFVSGRRATSADAWLNETVGGLAVRMGVRRPVRVLISMLADGPSVIGWLRPIVLLPPATVMGLTLRQLEAVLAHEIAHIRRHDYAVNIMQMAVETLLFYHPVVWWTSRQIRIERELCCDDLAVASCGDAVGYARALTTLEKLRTDVPSFAMGSTAGPLLYRIQRLLSVGGREYGPSRWPGVLALGLGLSCVALNVNWVRAQSQGDAPPAAFEVTSVRLNKSGEVRVAGGFQPGGRYKVTNYTLRALIAAAYLRPQVNPDFLIAGGPSWIDDERFDVEAKAAADFPAGPDGPSAPRRRMLQSLLGERFKLKVHSESRERSIYVLVMSRRDAGMGPNLRQSSVDCGPAAGTTAGATASSPRPACANRVGPGVVTSRGMSMAQLVNLLPRFVDRVVVDRTGLAGAFDLEIQWTPAQGEWVAPPIAGAAAPSADGPSLFTALQEQLGLKLESTTGPVDVLIVDRAEPPTED